MEDTAIIGIGCRVPGADNIDEFWRVLVNSENHIVEIPKERWNNDAFYSENRDEAGKTYVKKAGFINGHEEWDNKFFGVSDNEAINVDPQQRLVLECTHMALEDAGITKKQIQGTQTGVYIGAMNDDYRQLKALEQKDDTTYSATGTTSTIMSARVSYVYDLRGPCMVVDTACSSSLIAIHLGSEAIRTGDCEMAVCGGVNCMLSPSQFITLCKARMLSPTGQCQSFCDTADGYGRGEGCGIVIIKSYKKALEDKNKIWGIIKTATNQDGHAVQPITAPSCVQQMELFSSAYSKYGIDPTSLQYIEAHGTGTSLGDLTEIKAFGSFLEEYKSKHLLNDKKKQQNEVCRPEGHTIDEQNHADHGNKNTTEKKTKNIILIGSVKSNIGHLESAAGVAGLIKVLLMMKKGKFVPSLHVKKDKSNINKKIELERYGLDISLRVADWEPNMNGDRICCVNCFGFGGSNTHIIVLQNKHPIQQLDGSSELCTDNPYRIVCISNTSAASLKRKIEVFSEDIATNENELTLHDISVTSVFHRDHFPFRTFLFGKTSGEVHKQTKQKIDKFSEIETGQKIHVIFVFCGVGTTWKGMCREMMSTQKVFRKTVCKIDELLKPLTGWSIAEKFQDNTDYNDPFLNHIAIFCCQVSLFEQWKSWGIQPNTIVGQSVGEVAASVASGSLSLKDAVQVIYHRSKILSKITGGKMMVVRNIDIGTLETLCRKQNHRVTVAVYSSPVSATVSGDADAVDDLKKDLEEIEKNTEAGILITPLSVQCAYHSHQMEQCSKEIINQLQRIEKRGRMTDHYSTVTGKLAEKDDFQTGQYWVDNIRKPVLFMDAILKSTRKTATNVYVEIGPRQVLRAHLNNILGEHLKGVSLPSMNANNECHSIYSSLNKFFELGADIKWEEVASSRGQVVPIPRHVFQKTKVLYIQKAKQLIMQGIQSRNDSHMFLRKSTDSKADFSLHLDKETAPFVYDHFMYKHVLVPGATYIDAAFEVGHQKSSLTVFEIGVSIEFINTLMPENEKQCLADIQVTTNGPNKYQFHIRHHEKLLCQGHITEREDFIRKKINVKKIKNRCKTHRTKEESYKCLDKLHFQYGESLRIMEQSWSSSTECVVEFKIPDSVLRQRKVTHIHPNIIDGLFQIVGVLGTTEFDEPALPAGVACVYINRPPERNIYGFSQLLKSDPAGNHYNFFLLSEEGHVIAEFYDFYLRKVKIKRSENKQNIRHCLVWREIPACDITDQTEQKTETGSIGVFASERFSSLYKLLNKDGCHFFDLEKEGHNIKNGNFAERFESIIFSPSYHVQDMNNNGKVLFECILKSFLRLADLLNVLRQQKSTIPVTVVTENVIGLRQTTNVCGSELWGLVRSAICEGVAPDVKLVDMMFSKENALALQTILENNTNEFKEYLIENGTIFTCGVIEADDQKVPTKRELNLEMTDNTVLKTSAPLAVVRPFFDLRMLGDTNTSANTVKNQLKIRLKKICLHNSSIFLTSLGKEDEQSWTEEETGHSVICVEGIGIKHDVAKKQGEKGDVGFCFPVVVAGVISVPEICTFQLATLPVYVPGMFIVGIILWNIVDACKHSSQVVCIVEENSSLLQIIIRILFSVRTSSSVTFISQDVLCLSLAVRETDVKTVVILAELSSDQFDTVLERFPAAQNIVTIDEFVSKTQKMRMKIKNEGVSFNILRTDEMFVISEFIEKVPKIVNSFRSLGNKYRRLIANDNPFQNSDVFSLPYATLSLDKDGRKRIPLKVSRENVFRTNGCYVVVGGLTGLGWELVKYMAALGAKYIATFSRRLPDKNKENEIQETMEKNSCKIIPLQVDVTDILQLKDSIEKLNRVLGGDTCIRGILHGGGMTCDKLLKDMSRTDIETVLMPKVMGTWNLHSVTQNIHLDFFIMHSSIVSIFGNQGQCNYAAGNSFMDSFASYRRSIGLCGQSINWSALSVGMATENKHLEKHLSGQGFYFLSKEDIKECFTRAVMANQSQMIFGKFDWQRLQQISSVSLNPRKFADVLKKHLVSHLNLDVHTRNDGISEFHEKDPVQQKEMILALVKSKFLDTFVVDENKLTEETEILALGIDSMAAMSFTNVIFDVTNVRIPIGTLFDESATVGHVTSFVLERMRNTSVGLRTEIQQNDKRLKEYLSGDIPFMQKTLLDDFVRDPFSPNIMRQIDFEVIGFEIKKNEIEAVLDHMVRVNPELRRIYKIEKNGKYLPILLESDDVKIHIEDVDFSSICQDDSIDERHEVKIDITKDLPIKVSMASRKGTTRLRMYVHAVIGDLSGISNFFKEFATTFGCLFQKKELPKKKDSVNPAEAVRHAIMPQRNELIGYWKKCFQTKIEPFTLSADINDELEERYWEDLSLEMPRKVVDDLMKFISTEGVSIYHFIISTYMILLHETTEKHIIPLVTFVDMRSHVQQLQPIFQSCSNAVPMIGDLRNMGLLLHFLKRNSHQLNEALQHSAYPYELIQKEMTSEELKKHIGRHRFIMENMTSLNNYLIDGAEINICNLFYKRHVYETTLHVEYDTQQEKVTLHFGYNGKAIAKSKAQKLLYRMLQLITTFVRSPNKEVTLLLKEADLLEDGLALVTYPSTPQMSLINVKEEDRQGAERKLKCQDENNRIPKSTETKRQKHQHANYQNVRDEVICTARFTKQTTSGWEHSVELALIVSLHDDNTKDFFLTWGKGRKTRIVHGTEVSEVEIKKTNGLVYVLVKTYARSYTFKSPTLEQANEWLKMFKQADKEISHFNREELMCHF